MNQSTLHNELKNLEGIIHQHPETGKLTAASYVRHYTNRLFGAPFQLLNSVDMRFDEVNKHLGNEFLRNFMLNSPILRIRPGMPKYTGGTEDDNLFDMVKNLYFAPNTSDNSLVDNLLQLIAKSTVFKSGSKLQRRMFGFRETYYDYMQYVNYMCRSCATFLYLTDGEKFPTGAFTSTKDEYSESTMVDFAEFDWSNYRMLNNTTAQSPLSYLRSLIGHTADPFFSRMYGDEWKSNPVEALDGWLNSRMGLNTSDMLDTFDLVDQLDFAEMTEHGGVAGVIGSKVTTVDFLVEPGQYQESLTNQTAPSIVESSIDALKGSIGDEIGWITNSHADTGVVGGIMEFLGSGIESASVAVGQLVEGVSGGFMGGLFSGAVSSVKGQKMIYPEIYKSSNSTMNYPFKVLLSSPYGDVYNYYMNIIVPLMHLISLAAPRMVTANTVASPFIVQAYIPGQCTIQLGIISEMNITKNPNGNRVSVNGFPLEVEVSFTIKELYNAMSISPANDPASFLFNETLNDYMSNLAGLIPSIDTNTKHKQATFNALESYIAGGGVFEDIGNVIVEKLEDWANPFANR